MTPDRSRRLELLDWRRRVLALYAQVRDVAADPAAGPAAAHEHWRRARDELLRTHPQSPIPAAARSTFPGARYAPYDPALRFHLAVDTDVPGKRMDVPTATDGVVPFERVGVLHVPALGDLDVWWLASYGGGIFVPVKDGGAGRTTYGGGRYLLDTVKGADLGGDALSRALVIDLNFAYNPSCAYDAAWACPLAQAGNTLHGAVHAGELL